MKPMMVLLTAFLGLSACAKPGDFCEVWQGSKIFAPETARLMVQTDRPDVEGIKVENTYGEKHCN